MLKAVFLQIFLIMLNAVFACAEIAVVTINDNKLAKLAEEGNKRAIKLEKLTAQPAKFLATIQVAITFSGFLGSAFAADTFSDVIVEALINAGVKMSYSTLNTLAVIVITVILSYFTLVFGELVPKRIAMKQAEKIALGLSSTVSFIAKIFAPIVWLLTASTNGILRLLGFDPDVEPEEVTEEEIRMMLDQGSEKGTIDESEKEMITNVFEFDDISADEIMTHRTDVAVLFAAKFEEWHSIINATRFSVYPVCRDGVDDIVGILDAKEYFRLEDKTFDNIMSLCVKEPYYVPETIKADVLFKNMKDARNYFAVVIDNFGGFSGIITLNDLVEEIMGDIDGSDITPVSGDMGVGGSSNWIISGDADMEDVCDTLDVELPCDEFGNFGEFVFDSLGYIPKDGETFEVNYARLHISVREIKHHRIKSAFVTLLPEPEEEQTQKTE